MRFIEVTPGGQVTRPPLPLESEFPLGMYEALVASSVQRGPARTTVINEAATGGVITLTPGIIPDDATPEVDEDSANPGGVAYFPWVEITLAASEQDLIRGAPITIASRNPRRWIATADLGAQFNNEFTIQVVASPVVCRLFDFRRVGGVYIPIPWTRGTRETAANALAFKISGLNGQATVSLPGIDDLRDVIG